MQTTSNRSPSPICYCGCAIADDPKSVVEQQESPRIGKPVAVAILGTGSYVPDRVVTNEEVAVGARVETEWIVRRTAIRERRWAETGQATSDLAAEAARRALAAAGIDATELSSIVVATSTPDRPQPPTAAYVQHALGAGQAWAFDTNAVCSGFVFALATMESVVARQGGYSLVIGAEVYSRILDPADRRTVVLFGDGAGAVVLGPSKGRNGIRHTGLHTFGDQSELISVPAGGSREPYSPAAHDEGRHFFTMDGRAVRSFVTGQLPNLVKQFLGDGAIDPATVDHFIAHQANGVMLDDLVPQLGLTRAIEHRTVEDFGNTGAASIPITLDLAARSGKFRSGETILLAGFGGGMAAGLAVVEW